LRILPISLSIIGSMDTYLSLGELFINFFG
jgi:hypothetical protein